MQHRYSNSIGPMSEAKDLGINFDHRFTFISHIDQAISAVSRMLGFIMRNTREFKNFSSIFTPLLNVYTQS